MNGLNEGRDARHVRGRHGRAVRDGVAAAVEQQRSSGVDLVARSCEIDRVAIVGELGAAQGKPRLHVVGLTDRTHLGNTVKHRRNADTPTHLAILRRRGNIGRGSVVDRRIVDVDAFIACRRNNGQPLTLRVLDGSGRSLQAGRLLGIGRAPVDPRVHRIGIVDDVHPVARRPHERAGHVLGVDKAVVVGGLDGDDGRLRGDAVDADIVVIRGDNARDVRAVVELIAPAKKVLRGHAVDRTLHGALGIDATLQVRMRVLDAGVDDGNRHGGALDVHCPSLARVHGAGTPVEDLLGGLIGCGARGLVAHRVQAACSAGVRGGGLVLLIRGQRDALVVEDGRDARRADRVNRDAGLS